MSLKVWGDQPTQFFFELTPEVIFDAVEAVHPKLKCTGRAFALNSMENRVYEVEMASRDDATTVLYVIKFYRPGRWTKEQILEEHEFLKDLGDHELPAVAPVSLSSSTLHEVESTGIYFSLFPKQAGRMLQEMTIENADHIGRLLARLHRIGKSKPSQHRIAITPDTYGVENIEGLRRTKLIPMNHENAYLKLCDEIVKKIQPMFRGIDVHRIHGDCHLGNILFGKDGYFLVDFDDMVVGPPVQDIWLLLPGRDEYSKQILNKLLTSYEVMHDFDDSSLRLMEPLRALRFIHFNAWVAKRWEDPVFKKTFDRFTSDAYWQEQKQILAEQNELIK